MQMPRRFQDVAASLNLTRKLNLHQVIRVPQRHKLAGGVPNACGRRSTAAAQ